MAESPVDGIPVRTQLAIYGSGTFSNSMGNLAGVLVPLWVVTFGVSGLLVGLVFGARHILPLVLSIHGGALMDRLGTRRVMLVFAVINASVPLLFPLLPNVWMAIGLQAIAGLATSMGWIGAQTLIGQVMKGDTTHAGRLTLSLRFGHLVGPPLIGMAWDLAGPWGAFGVMSLWGWLGFFAALMLPKLDALDGEPRPRVTVRDLLPRWSDYVAAFRMLAVSAILFVAMITMLRNAGNTIQHSFYVVYLNDVIGLSGTAIGFLTSFAAVIGGAGALSVGALARRFTPHWLLLVTVIGAVALIAAIVR
jgi:MFS family permease